MTPILPNELCPCNSGKNYSDCCLPKIKIDATERSRNMFYADVLKALKKASAEYCIHPQKSECDTEIIRAHNIQHNGILSKLAVDGEVFMPISNIFEKRLTLKSKGISGQATVFTGFCKKHDKSVFSKIEDFPFTKTSEQLFLYAYKAFALTYYKIQREVKRDEILFQKYDFSNHIYNLYFRELHKLTKKCMDYELDNFNTCLLTENYDHMKSFIGKLDYEVNFAVSSAFEVEYDLLENKITNFPFAEKLSLIYLTVFPGENCSYYLISFFKENDDLYSHLIKQISIIPRHLLLKYLNNLIILNAENIVISPRLYNAWSKSQIEDFENTIQVSIDNHIKGEEKYKYFATRSFNIFEKI